MIDDHAKFLGRRFRDGVHGRAVHARKEVRPEGCRQSAGLLLRENLMGQECTLFVGFERTMGVVVRYGIFFSFVWPWPKTVT